jgi:hypothetical protein
MDQRGYNLCKYYEIRKEPIFRNLLELDEKNIT